MRERLGIALKFEDGTEEAWPVIIARILEQLEYPHQQTMEILSGLAPEYLLNDNKTVVGERRAVFKLVP